MDFSKVHNIAIIGTDFEEMKEFYIDKLGFTLLDKHIRPEKMTSYSMLDLKKWYWKSLLKKMLQFV